jgi:hypothetical protein
MRYNVLQAAVEQALTVLSAIVNELNDDERQRLLSFSPRSKFALIQRPDQVWTNIPEHLEGHGHWHQRLLRQAMRMRAACGCQCFTLPQ